MIMHIRALRPRRCLFLKCYRVNGPLIKLIQFLQSLKLTAMLLEIMDKNIHKEDVAETNNYDTEKLSRLKAYTLLVGIMDKLKKEVVTESNNQDTEEYTKLDACSLLEETSFSSSLLLNLFPMTYYFEKKKSHRSTEPKNESQEQRAVRLAKMSARSAQRIANESPAERAQRLAKMSARSAQRIANESLEERVARLKRMSECAAKRLAQETKEQRSRRLRHMSLYSAKRLANETVDQRRERLLKMSAYTARRRAEKKAAESSQSSNMDAQLE